MAYKTILPFDTASAFSPGAYTGYNPLSFSLGDYVNAPALSPVSTLTDYSPNSFIGDLSGFGSTATPGFMESPFMKNMLGYKAADGTQHMGWGGLALGSAQALGSMFSAFQNYGLQERALKEQIAASNRNFRNQETALLADASDKDRARAASREGAENNPYQSMTKTLNDRGIA